ncbi:MAG: 1-acyl-sn-glycerol-3-phosphate acyltransferase [Clostridia bacterium]|nr:1-acyl-sn-glycerol-3-phosphate acyltransferase [Clostridia bacterium]
MLYLYFFLSVAILFVTDRLSPVFSSPHGWWLTPVILIGLMLGFIIIHLLILVISIAVVDLDKDSEKGNGYYRKLVNCSLPLLFKICRVKVHVTGEEIIPENERILLVSNHINDIDPAIFIEEFPGLELGFIAKKEIYTELRFVAKMMKKLYCIPIDRENNREAIKAIIKAVDYIKNDKASIGIFPEGYTSLDGELHDFRNGAFKIATKAKVPIVVCTIVGSDKCFANLIKRRTDVYVDVVKVLSSDEVSSMHTDAIGEIVHKAMEESLKNRKEEIKKNI